MLTTMFKKKKGILRKSVPQLIAVEVTTTFTMNGVSNRMMERYIVVARSVSSAVEALTLRENEEILQAREMTHKLVLAGKK